MVLPRQFQESPGELTPTSQDLAQVERDLTAVLPVILLREVARRCEHLIRNYDPCISCATHFLKVKIDRV